MTIITIASGNRIRLRRKMSQAQKSLPEGVKKRRVNICLSPHWHEAAKEKVATRRLSFPDY